MIKGYVKVNGMWHKVYELNDWWDVVCWAFVGLIIVFLAVQAWKVLA